MLKIDRRGLVALLLLALAGCAEYTDKRGIEVTWDPSVLASFEVGRTTRQEVLTALGPPSQVIAVGEETALYYLFERTEGQGVILLLYNRFDRTTRYDRAVFFFDDHDLLQDFANRSPDIP